ncbi:MAG: helix-turn-helix transcriptional regulator [Candidatus Geothermarchaeales archaeon]
MSDTNAYKALASKSRVKMLGLLYKGPKSIEEISKETGLQPITVRHHLRYLEESGFVASFEQRSGLAGRPKIYYKIVKEPTVIVFPKRHYLMLLDSIITRLPEFIGQEKANETLRKICYEIGKDMVNKLALDHGIKEWTPEAFGEIYVMKHLDDLGAEPEVVQMSEKEVVYRVNNCLFLELALKHPELICETMEDAVEAGASQAMNPEWKLERLKCIAHGDDTCEFKLTIK